MKTIEKTTSKIQKKKFESFAKQQRLFRQLKFLTKKQQTMINDELRNIEKLKRKKQKTIDLISIINVFSKFVIFVDDLKNFIFMSFLFFDEIFEFFF